MGHRKSTSYFISEPPDDAEKDEHEEVITALGELGKQLKLIKLHASVLTGEQLELPQVDDDDGGSS